MSSDPQTTHTNQQPRRTEILIVEDHDSLRNVLPTALELEDDFHSCGCAKSGEEALEYLNHMRPDVALVDLSLPGMDGIQLIMAIKESHPETCCVVLSAYQERDYAQLALDAGASGYIVKGKPSEMIEGIRRALSGEVYLSEHVAPRPKE